MMFTLHRILRHRIETDGKGVTTLIGLAFCPLSCRYCLNAKMLRQHSVINISPEELLEILMQDACYMIGTGGGVTFGGGEPLLQFKALLEFAKIKPKWMKMNLETSLQAPGEIIKMLIPYIDEWIVDIKTLDPVLYKKYAEWPADDMLKNLDILADSVPDKCRIRIPVIPNYKDKDTALKEEALIRDKGFTNTETFEYIIRGRKL